MKERVTKFDLENAFKALDEIAIPKVGKVRPNRPDLKESVKRVDRTSMLVEDYYDLYNREDVNELKEDREAEIASAKLAKIEKIVDLDAESPEDLQPTYVGKTIIQCPQCLTLFYKDPADIIVSEENPDMVNVDEVCQHCGNDSGYTIIGKVAEEEVPVDELPQEAIPEDIPEENDAEVKDEAEEDIPMTDEEPAEGEESTDLDLETAPDESAEEEQEEEEVKESLNETYYTCAEIDGEERRFPFNSREEARKYAAQISAGEAPEFKDKKIGSVWTEGLDGRLNEDVDLNKQLDLYNDFIKYLQKMVEQDEDALAEAKKLGNKEVIAALEKRLESSRAELKAALPEAVKDEVSSDNLPSADEVPMEDVKEEEKKESLEKTVDDDLKDVRVDVAKGEVKTLEENLNEAKTKKVYNTYTNIMWDLVGGRVEKDEKGRNSYSQGCGYTVYDTGVDKDDNITVFAKTKEGLNNAIEVAKKYNHEYLGPMEAKKPGYYMITIIIKPEDYEDGAFEESLKAGSLQEALHKFPEIGVDELDNFFKVCDKIGIKTMADLQRFKQEHCANGEDLLKALNDYAINELGIDFKVEEEAKKPLKEEDDLSDAEFAQLLNSDEFKTPISETEVEAYLDESKEEVKFDEIEDFQEQLFNEHVTKYLNEVYSNVESFETTNCTLDENKFIVEGNIKFKSGKTKKMSFDFKADNKGLLEGYSKNIPVESKFTLKYNINKDKTLVTESLAYKYKINGTEVSGETK